MRNGASPSHATPATTVTGNYEAVWKRPLDDSLLPPKPLISLAIPRKTAGFAIVSGGSRATVTESRIINMRLGVINAGQTARFLGPSQDQFRICIIGAARRWPKSGSA